jgi:quercetin dioxygenase-like cupin family protein
MSDGFVLTKFKDAPAYDASGHVGSVSYRMQHRDMGGPKSFWVALSYFLPGGGAEMSASDAERVYVVLSGSVTVISEDGQEYSLNAMDSLYVAPGTKRSIVNRSKEPAAMLVIATYGQGKRRVAAARPGGPGRRAGSASHHSAWTGRVPPRRLRRRGPAARASRDRPTRSGETQRRPGAPR